MWTEQLVAESTGKEGKGILPVEGEPLGGSSDYGSDRFFAALRRSGDEDGWRHLGRLVSAGHPAASGAIEDPLDLGAQMFLWEFATAVAGRVLGINPFDQPNVQEAKDATKVLLTEFKAKGRLPMAAPDHSLDGISLTLTSAARKALPAGSAEAVLTLLRPGDYFALLAYLGFDPALAAALQAWRRTVRDRARVATMFGYGPRYLHSTGQLHKGGPNSGVFVLISATPAEDVAIPGEPFSFGTLEQAQAIGDFASLEAAGRRAVHAHLPSQDSALIRTLADALLAKIPGSG
jgi:hypothetical protein